MTLRRSFLAFVTTAVALSAGCGVRTYLPVSNMPVALPQAAGTVDALGKPKPKPSTHPDRPITFTMMSGTVTQLLPDDTQGLPHQHFLYRSLTDGRIYKVAHNTELAPHVPVHVGDKVNFKGEVVASKPNNIMHWTHWNPNGGEGGYIELNGVKYDKIPGSH